MPKTISPKPIFIQSLDEFKKIENIYQEKQYLQFKCEQCNTITLRRNWRMKKNGYFMLCNNCLFNYRIKNRTNEKRKEILEKRKQTNFKRYGVEYSSKSQEIQDRMKQACLEKHGVEYTSQIEKSREKCKQTWKNKSEKEKQQVLEKKKQTCLKKYGVDSYFKTNKFKEDMLFKFGTAHPLSHKYMFKDQSFDSSWELAVYIWSIENGKNIIRGPVGLEYVHEGKIHTYYPDFKIDGKLVEVKGAHFFKEDETMQNPFNSKENTLFEAKHQCGLKHGVEFWSSKEIKPILIYVKNKYGKDWKKKFKKK